MRKRPAFPALPGLVVGIVAVLLALVHFAFNPQVLYYNLAFDALTQGSFTFSQWFSVLPLIAGGVSILLSVMARKSLPLDQRSLATAGLVLGIIGAGLGAMQFVACGVCICAQMQTVGL